MTVHLPRISFAVLFIGIALSFQNCAKTEETPGSQFPFSSSNQYFSTTQKFTTEVYYEPGAEPFTGTTARGIEYWQILQDNLVALFQFRSAPPTFSIPKTLTEMTAIPAQSRTAWTANDLSSLNANYRKANPSDTEARFYIYFVKGYFDSGSGPNMSVIGVSLSGTPIIAIFKQVIQNSGTYPNGAVPKFVEQSTLVHEMGHALGFVNAGVPMAGSNHQDTAHGSHATDPNCVMYWQNEGAASLATFVQKFLNSNSVVMWGPDVLNDAKAFSR